MMAHQRILILDGMWNKSLAAVRSFGRKGFYVAVGERTRFATALFSRYCNKRFIYPSPSVQQEGFLKCLENELKNGNYDVVFPMELSTQLLLVSNRERISRYCLIPFADAEKTMQVHDKAFLMRYAEENGFEIPRTYFVETPENVIARSSTGASDEAILKAFEIPPPHLMRGRNDKRRAQNDSLGSFSDEIKHISKIADKIEYPVLIKPRMSSGSRGMVYVKNSEELIPAYSKVHKEYPFPIIQECITGDETYGVGLLLNSESEVRASFVYKRLRSYPVSGGPSTLRESVKRDDIRGIAKSLLKSLKWTGIAHIEFKIDPRDGRPKLLEINPRFWGSLELAVTAGVDFPYLLYQMALNGDIHSVTDYTAGVRCRWLIPGDMLHFLKNPDRFRLKPSFFDFRTKDDIISLKDPLPTIGRISSALTFLYDKEMRSLIER